jgi:putative transposase
VPQSLAQILVHVVFSTKNREPLLEDTVHTDLQTYIGGIIARHNGTLLKAGSVTDHIHLLIAHPRTLSPAELVQEMKTGSSKWIKTRGHRYDRFHWQAGYGMFSVSSSHRRAVEAYLEHQAEHHRKVSFQDEYRNLLRRHGVEYDELYVWD